MKIMLLSPATSSVSSGNVLAFNVIGSKVCEIVGDATGDTQLLILLPMNGNKVSFHHNVKAKTFSPNFCHALLN